MNKNFKKILVFILIVIVIFISYILVTSNSKTEKPSLKKHVKTEEKKKLKLREGEELIETTSKGYSVTKLKDIYYVDGVLIVNKTYPLPENYQPINPYKEITSDYLYGGDYIEEKVMNQFLKMQSDASKKSLSLKISSGYRSYKVQVDLYNNYVAKDGKDAADTYSARPGFSEHQSGLSFDLNGTNENFIDTKEGKWLNDNCYKYGFILRFPSGSEDKTGYMYEAWHFRYVGTKLAKKLYNNGSWISLEEYFGINSKYND